MESPTSETDITLTYFLELHCKFKKKIHTNLFNRKKASYILYAINKKEKKTKTKRKH